MENFIALTIKRKRLLSQLMKRKALNLEGPEKRVMLLRARMADLDADRLEQKYGIPV
ncbi:hypothetical protein [Desulfobotulus sp.]|jgi:hypothetical protein|uniref:hypothetical protein n=1 Tax=Desulfobotulus sp. TaxID=1940337 RepID=UPI002A36D286|nr:hypothetical protein [Desulfobotulus sp.]MDY0164881.1 hypothetical protein [Desulfobotulus sp.]